MSFLELNGVTIPVALGGSSKPKEIGDRGRSINGTYRNSVRTSKKEWMFRTTQLTQAKADIVEGLVRGEGDHWAYDSDVISDKGIDVSSTEVVTYRSNTAADGDPVKDATTGTAYDEAKFTDCVAIEDSTTNMLTSDQATAENAPTGYTVMAGSTLSADTSNYWQGSKSVKAVTPGSSSAEGLYCSVNPGSGSNGKTYTATVYVKGDSGSEALRIVFIDITNAQTIISNFDAVGDQWTRFQSQITVSGGDSSELRMRVETRSAAVVTFYCDGFQIEEGEFPTSWVDGSRTFGNLEYLGKMSDYAVKDITVNLWSRGPAAQSVSSERYFVELFDNPSKNALVSLRANRGGANNYIRIVYFGTSTDLLQYNSAFDDAWHMLTFVMRFSPVGSEKSRELYMDGVLVSSDTTSNVVDYTLFDSIKVGEAAAFLDGVVDDLTILPYALDADTISGIYAAGVPFSTLPALTATGDFDAKTRTVIGEVENEEFVNYASGGTHHNNGRAIDFSLRER